MNTLLDSVGYGQWILHALLVLPLVGALLVAWGRRPWRARWRSA
jgi:hypothetical protein